MDNLGCLLIIGVILLIFFGVLWMGANARAAEERTRQAAYDAYQASLAKLKASPANPDLKQRALQLGREYANRTRNQKGVTVFDEVALANDISAATAGAMAAPVVSAPPSSAVEDRLRALESLRTKGLIGDAEYTEKRKRLIDEM
jgi:hypothetical protein